MSWSKSDTIATAAIIVSLLAAIYSYTAAKDARLDAKRQYLRSDAIALLNSVQTRLSLFDCHFVANGKPVDASSTERKELLEGLEKSRGNLSQIDGWEDHQLDAFRSSINLMPAEITHAADEMIRRMRSQLSNEDIERVNQVCRIDG